jgi:LPXTG-site transpeptidase (sortase) family protein
MKKLTHILANLNIVVGIFLAATSVLFLVFPQQKTISADERKRDRETAIIQKDLFTEKKEEVKVPEVILVPENEAVTYGSTIKVPSVGIDTSIYESKNINAALDKGVWRMPEHGTPANEGTTTVLAAHRWGPDNMPTEKRIKDLFYSLDKVNTGDVIEINWNGETYTYVVKDKEENSIVSKKPGDLILVTCKYYNSSMRIIVYADRVEI